jgi:hypothetical protein
MPGNGNDDRLGRLLQHLIDELELLFWPQGGLEHDDIIGAPLAFSGRFRPNGFGRHAQASCGQQSALREHQVVLDHKEPPRHGSHDSRSISQLTVLAIAKHHLSLL